MQNYLYENSILYIEPNKKRTDKWLSLNRLQLPLGETKYGPIRSITYVDGKVKIKNSTKKTAMQIALEKAGAVDEYGNERFFLKKENPSNALEKKVETEYNKNTSYSLRESAENERNIATIKKIILSIKGKRGLKYDGGRVIRIPNNDMETLRHKFMTEHHYSNRSGGNIDCIDCFGQGGEKHYFYIFYVGEDNRVAPIFRLDYQYIERYVDDIQKISNEMGYSKDEFVNATSGNGKGIDRIRNLSKSNSIYDVSATGEETNRGSGKIYNNESRSGTTDNRRNDSELSNGYNERGDNGEIVERTSYSLKNWRTDLTATQFKQVETWLRQIDNHEPKRIADTDACWYKGRINGYDLFVIYSTADINNPTILYERKGAGGNIEQNILLTLLEEKENGESNDRKSAYVNWVSGSGWVQNVNGSQNNIAGLGTGTNNQNAGVLPGQSKRNGSRAFWNVVENLFRKQEQDGRLNEVESHSLKGGISATELLDTIEGVQKGKEDAKRKLAKYAEDGIVSTEHYNKLVKKYGAIPSGENPHRDVQVPKKTAKNKKVSQTVRTILEAKATPDEALPTIEKMVEDGVFSYDAYTDEKAIKDAVKHLKDNGWTTSLNAWMRDVEKGVVSKQHTVMGWALYNNAVNRATTTTSATERREAMETALSVLDGMIRHQRSAAQALQATRVLKKLSPETQLYRVTKSVQAFQKELIDKYGDKAPDLKINEKLAEQFLSAKTEDARLEAEKEIYKDIGRQMPSTFADKWNAWRYVAMLANVRTHVRNIEGNAFFAPVVLAKNLTATAIESVVNRVSHKKIVRGKALITGSKADKALLKAAWDDYANVADIISGEGKYGDFSIEICLYNLSFKFITYFAIKKPTSHSLDYGSNFWGSVHFNIASSCLRVKL